MNIVALQAAISTEETVPVMLLIEGRYYLWDKDKESFLPVGKKRFNSMAFRLDEVMSAIALAAKYRGSLDFGYFSESEALHNLEPSIEVRIWEKVSPEVCWWGLIKYLFTGK